MYNPDWTLPKKTLRKQCVFGKIFYGATNPNFTDSNQTENPYIGYVWHPSSKLTTQSQIRHQNN